jgi:tape measure domain-containing protein
VADKVGGVYIEIQARMGSLEKDLRTIQTRMQQVDNTGAKFSGTMAKLGKYLAAGAVAAGIYQIGKASLSAAANMEQQKVAFTSMLGSAEKAQKLLDQMQTFAASTPFQLNEIVDAGKKLVAFGEDAENVTKTLGRIGDVASGLGIPLGELTEIYGKARVQQTLYAEDLNQLAGRGIPIFEELAKVMNVNASEVKKLGSEGKISFEMLEQVFGNLTGAGGKFAGLMDAQSKTLAGKWSNFNDQIDKTLLLLGDKMAPAAGETVTMFSLLLQKMNESLEASAKLAASNPSAGMKSGVSQINAMLDGTIDKLDGMQQRFDPAKVKALYNEIDLISEGWGDASEYVEQMTAKYGKLETATILLRQYNQGFIYLNKDQIAQMEEIVRLEQERVDKASYYTKIQNRINTLAGDILKTSKVQKKNDDKAQKAAADKWKKMIAEAESYYKKVRDLANSTDDPVKQVENEIAALDVGMTRTEWLYEKGKISKQKYENTLASYTEARIKKEEELEQAKFDRMRDYYNLGVSTLTGFSGQINELASMYASNQTTRIEQEAQKRTDALNAEYENQVAIIEASAASDSQKAEQKKALDEQLARDTKAISDKAEKDKRKAQRESAKISKQLAIFDTLINTPAAALQAFRAIVVPNMPWTYPLGIAAAVATTGLGLAKLKLISDQPLPALAEGGIVPAIPGGRQITVAEGGNSEGVIPFNDRGVDILAQAMEKAISKIGRGGGTTNVYIDSELIYSNMYEASRRGAVKIDQRAIV